MNPADKDRIVLAGYVCPKGRLCECDHVQRIPEDADVPLCAECGCKCPLPGPDERSGNPDACPCCGADLMIGYLGAVVHDDDA